MTNPSNRGRHRSPKYAQISKRRALKKARTRDEWEARKCAPESR